MKFILSPFEGIGSGGEFWRPAIDQLLSCLALNGFVPSIILTMLCYALFLGARVTPWGLAALAFPGTLAHELAHFIIGFILRAKPSGLSLWPKRSGKGWRLGEVRFRRIGVLNGGFIALAPVLLFPLGWLCLIHLSIPAWVTQHWLIWLATGYLSATLLYASVPSLTDLKIGAWSLLAYSSVAVLCWVVLPVLHSLLQ
jgi:hypothetical protein